MSRQAESPLPDWDQPTLTVLSAIDSLPRKANAVVDQVRWVLGASYPEQADADIGARIGRLVEQGIIQEVSVAARAEIVDRLKDSPALMPVTLDHIAPAGCLDFTLTGGRVYADWYRRNEPDLHVLTFEAWTAEHWKHEGRTTEGVLEIYAVNEAAAQRQLQWHLERLPQNTLLDVRTEQFGPIRSRWWLERTPGIRHQVDIRGIRSDSEVSDLLAVLVGLARDGNRSAQRRLLKRLISDEESAILTPLIRLTWPEWAADPNGKQLLIDHLRTETAG